MTDFDSLLDLMQREGEAVQRLKSLLLEEEKALIERRVEAVVSLAEQKQACMAELEPFGAERARLLAGAGLSADRAGFETLLGQAGPEHSAQLQSHWEELRQELTACQEQNLKNGQILESSRRFVGDVLAILLGERQGTELYGSDGSAHQSHGNRTYVKA